MIIDLRSDTVTKPTPEMKEAMFAAELGDDVYSEDPSINSFEAEVASYFGKEKAIFCPSGTMANQIGLRLYTRPQDEIICDDKSHIYRYEGGGIFFNSLCSVKLLSTPHGILDPDEIAHSINPRDIHFPKTSLISLENTCNKGGGSYYELDRIQAIREVADNNDLNMHLDGARLFNAIVASGAKPKDIALNFETISICFSKGMGCPVGSVLLTSSEKEFDARRYRKVFGGGMRQAGMLAAAASFALRKNVERLADDHKRIHEIGQWLLESHYIKKVYPHPTNILLFELENPNEASRFKNDLESKGILISAFDENTLRIVTHLDFNDQMMDELIEFIKKWR